jgi:hypothetical protein
LFLCRSRCEVGVAEYARSVQIRTYESQVAGGLLMAFDVTFGGGVISQERFISEWWGCCLLARGMGRRAFAPGYYTNDRFAYIAVADI